MSTPNVWKPLPIGSSADIPALLVSFMRGPSEYSIRITDLSNVWSETLDRKAICIRAWGENTSIDPSDTPDNMVKFLACLESALDGEQRSQRESTSVELSKGLSSEHGDDGLELQVTCELAGFPNLVWPFHLKKLQSAAITTELVLPLIEAHYLQSRQVNSLIQLLKHKDSVIGKLSDKLDAMGTGLEQVFTALAGRKSTSKALAEEKIRGLASFNESSWKSSLAAANNEPSSVAVLAEEVFGGAGLACTNFTAVDKAVELNSWWQHFKPATSLNAQYPKQSMGSKPRTPSPPPKNNNRGDSDDEFQIQSTPPHLKSASKKHNSIPDDIDMASPVPAVEIIQEVQRPSTRLGAIGGNKKPPALPVRSSKSPEKKPVNHDTAVVIEDEETASETASDVDETASIPEEKQSSPPPPPPSKVSASSSSAKAAPVKKIGGLGRIGGGPKLKIEEAEPTELTETTVPAPPTKKLGVIGGRKIGGTEARSTVPVEEQSRGRQSVRQKTPNIQEEERQVRETSQERADRKREELKRELEKQAAAGPTKKKRRF